MAVAFWNEVLDVLAQKKGSILIKQWGALTNAEYDMDRKLVTIETPNEFIKDSVNYHYKEIKKIVDEIMFTETEIQIVKKENLGNVVTLHQPKATVTHKEQQHKEKRNPILNTRFIFDTFIVGSNNQFAQAAALSVSARPSESYNPLFIFSESGLGKTHLLHAIGNYVCENFPKLKVIYVSSERFVNEFVMAIKNKTLDQFRKKYREDVDVLLLDDIQFFAGKEQTQEELFHTILYAQETRKQIVAAADRYPNDIEGLDNRLKTRLSGGLVTDIKKPGLETRLAILEMKSKELNIGLPKDSAMVIASHYKDNVRELEGALTRVSAYASFANMPLTADMVSEFIHSNPNNNKELSVESINEQVSKFFNISPKELLSSTRKKEISLPRHISMFLARKYTNKSYPDLAKLYGRNNHTTVMHACIKIQNLMNNDLNLRKDVGVIEERISHR
jgi:chromosomal replication initiator protein